MGIRRSDQKHQNRQYHCEASFAVWSRDLENNCQYHEQNSVIYQHLPQKNPTNLLSSYYQQPGAVAMNKTAACRARNSLKTLKMDWSHSLQTCNRHYKKHYVLFWNPQGKRKRGRPRNTRQHDLKADVQMTGLTWKSWRNWPRTGMSGKPLLKAYAQSRATGNKIR